MARPKLDPNDDRPRWQRHRMRHFRCPDDLFERLEELRIATGAKSFSDTVRNLCETKVHEATMEAYSSQQKKIDAEEALAKKLAKQKKELLNKIQGLKR